MSSMRGLVVFISDLRNARARELEEKRINRELANVRQKFKDSKLDGYQKKKYVCKLLYIYILGYHVDFGYLEAVNLISSNKFSEKQIGYLAVTLFLHENHDLLNLVVNSIRKDLLDHSELSNCLALHAIANVGSREIGEAVGADVHQLLISAASSNFVKKKAALTLLRLYRKFPQIIDPKWVDRIVAIMDDPDLGVTLSVVSLVSFLAKDNPSTYENCYAKAIGRLKKIVLDHDYTHDYVYYKVPCPWLQVKLLQLIRMYKPPENDALRNLIVNIIQEIIENSSEAPRNVQENNAQKAVLFEAINVAIHIEVDEDTTGKIVVLLGHFISSRETNARYLGLETMAHLAASSDAHDSLKRHQSIVMASLKDRDISVRRKGLDLLYSMCDASNAQDIVTELLKYLYHADHAIREEMVLKIAILTEKYATDYRWYIDITLQLLSVAGDHVSEEVWQRAVQVVTNNEELQEYAVNCILEHFKSATNHESLVKVGSYVLGEFGHLVAENPGCSPIEQFTALQNRFPSCSHSTQCMILSTYIKFVNLFPEIKPQLLDAFRLHSRSVDSEIQQRACEYLALASLPADDLLVTMCDEMPPFSERASALLSRLHGQQPMTDKRKWSIGKRPGQGKDQHILTEVSTVNGAKDSDASGTSDLVNGIEHLRIGNGPTMKDHRALHLSPGWEKGYRHMILRDNGLLFDDMQLAIGMRSEYHGSNGRISLHYRNHLATIYASFTCTVSPVKGVSIISANIPETTLRNSEQVQQMLQIEAQDLFDDSPFLSISYLAGALQTVTLKLPVLVTKFMNPTTLETDDFFKRWKQIGQGSRESQSVLAVANSQSIDHAKLSSLIAGLHWGILENVDPIITNFVAASILHTSKAGNFGCMLRVEPKFETKVSRTCDFADM